jgi:catechol 2,3-dioxygenase-like lactoylglutathione lyase family enzyme
MPSLTGVIETALYVDDLDRASRFYEDVFGLTRIIEGDARIRAYGVGGRSVLLLFKRGASNCRTQLPFGTMGRTTAADRCMWPLRSPRRNWGIGRRGSLKRKLLSRAGFTGPAAAPVCTSAIRIIISSSWRHPEFGPFTEAISMAETARVESLVGGCFAFFRSRSAPIQAQP